MIKQGYKVFIRISIKVVIRWENLKVSQALKIKMALFYENFVSF